MSQLKFDRLFALLAIAAVGTGLIVGFWLLGSPGKQRQIKADQQRLVDMREIAQRLHQEAEQSQNRGKPVNLPASLPTNQRQTDPISGKQYEYQRIDPTHYKLCATFVTDSTEDYLSNSFTTKEDFWQHPTGRYCFQLDVLQDPSQLYSFRYEPWLAGATI